MLGFNELYEILRKEKYSESLQPLPKDFIEQFRKYLDEKLVMKSKKQLENSLSLFRELILKRKKKILNLVFIATETGIMKKDYDNMIPIEKETFDSLVKSFENEDKYLSNLMNNKEETKSPNKMIIFKTEVEQFIDYTGNSIGPFKSGQLANLDSEVAEILVSGEKASFVDEQ